MQRFHLALHCSYTDIEPVDLQFEWDNRRNGENKRKHGVSFEEAQTAFLDDRALIVADPNHSDDETRFILLGLSATLKLLVVCHCFRDDDSVIRIISSRKANRGERNEYNRRWKR